jgi:hypothetical protein
MPSINQKIMEGTLTGTLRPQEPLSGHYQRNYIARPNPETNSFILLRLWLDGDTGFTLSQYREWHQLAEEFLGTITYSKKEQKMLLAMAFDRWLQDKLG